MNQAPFLTPAQETRTSNRSDLWKWLLAAWLAGSLLFAHGCHGNEDQELFGVSILSPFPLGEGLGVRAERPDAG